MNPRFQAPIALLLIAAFASTGHSQIRRFHSIEMAKDSDTSRTSLVYVSSYLEPSASLFAVSVEAAKPDSLDMLFLSANADDLVDSYLFVETASDIRFQPDYRPRYAGPLLDSVAFLAVRISWQQFKSVCDQQRLRVHTSKRIFTFTNLAIRNLKDFQNYLSNPYMIEDSDGPPDFVPYEKEPVVLKKADPRYPEVALRAGLEGNVYLKVWVDKLGDVREVIVLKSDAEIFNLPAIEAARQWKFTPAVLAGRPISVWVSIPFRFRLMQR